MLSDRAGIYRDLLNVEPLYFIVYQPKPSNDLSCSLCKTVMELLDAYLTDPTSEQAVLERDDQCVLCFNSPVAGGWCTQRDLLLFTQPARPRVWSDDYSEYNTIQYNTIQYNTIQYLTEGVHGWYHRAYRQPVYEPQRRVRGHRTVSLTVLAEIH